MIATALIAASLVTGDLATFHIGNSLTWDSQPTLLSSTVGHHILCSAGLDDIAASPESTCVTPPFGPYQTALANSDWTTVFVQPFDGSTLEVDAAFVRDVHAREPNAQIVLYESWPNLATFEAHWLRANNGQALRSRAYFDALSAELSDVPHDRVSVGETLFQLRDDIELASLYRDDIHLSYDRGRYVAHASVHHFLTGTFPDSSTLSAGLSEAEIGLIHNTIASVPESSSICLLGIAAAMGVMFRQLRRLSEMMITSCRLSVCKPCDRRWQASI